jgi:hypothetical protein
MIYTWLTSRLPVVPIYDLNYDEKLGLDLCFYRWVIIFSGRKLEWFIIRSDKWGNMSISSCVVMLNWR